MEWPLKVVWVILLFIVRSKYILWPNSLFICKFAVVYTWQRANTVRFCKRITSSKVDVCSEVSHILMMKRTGRRMNTDADNQIALSLEV